MNMGIEDDKQITVNVADRAVDRLGAERAVALPV